MELSRDSIEALSDLIENRLSIMTVNDQDDLRERLKLQRALSELREENAVHAGVLKNFTAIPRRGRRRKVSTMIEGQD
jgi:hypothetical protein